MDFTERRTGGKTDLDLYRANLDVIERALLESGPRKVLALEAGIDESQLSKLLGGSLNQFCKILSLLHLEIVEEDYIKSLRVIVRRELKP